MQEKLFIKNNRGLKLAAILHKPQDFRNDKKYPVVIVLHGFTGYKEEPDLEILANDLEKNGFVVVRFDASGFGESEGTLSADYLFSNYLQDTEYIYEFLKSQLFVDKNRIGIAGHSWGGKMTVIFTARHPETKAAVPISAVSTLRKSNWLSAFILLWRREGHFRRISSKYGPIKIPYEVVKDDDKFYPIVEVRRIHCPIFFILGLADDTVLPKDTRMIYANANEPKKIWEVEGVGHDYRKHSEQIEMINREVVKFFQENLQEKETIFGKIKNIFQNIRRRFS